MLQRAENCRHGQPARFPLLCHPRPLCHLYLPQALLSSSFLRNSGQQPRLRLLSPPFLAARKRASSLSLAGSLTPYNNFEYEAQFKSRNVPPRPLSLQLEILTWEKDSHGLFDYEATKHVKEYFEIQGPCKVFRNWYRKPALMQKRRPASLRTTRSRRDSFPMRPSTSSPPSRCAIMATRKVKHELRKASCSTRPNGPRRRS